VEVENSVEQKQTRPGRLHRAERSAWRGCPRVDSEKSYESKANKSLRERKGIRGKERRSARGFLTATNAYRRSNFERCKTTVKMKESQGAAGAASVFTDRRERRVRTAC